VFIAQLLRRFGAPYCFHFHSSRNLETELAVGHRCWQSITNY